MKKLIVLMFVFAACDSGDPTFRWGTSTSTPVPGPAGQQGPQGPAGQNGTDGRDGVDGKDGRDGRDGARGPAGQNGTDGRDGARGPQGPAGQDGTDGTDGARGPQGPQGPAGQNGSDGEDGQDGTSCTITTINGKPALVCEDGTVHYLDCNSNADCNDNNACTTDACQAGECKYSTVTCWEGYSCQPSNGCVQDPTPECTSNSQCNDGKSCTSDSCQAGVCVSKVICDAGYSCSAVTGACVQDSTSTTCQTLTVSSLWIFQGIIGPVGSDGWPVGEWKSCPNDPEGSFEHCHELKWCQGDAVLFNVQAVPAQEKEWGVSGEWNGKNWCGSGDLNKYASTAMFFIGKKPADVGCTVVCSPGGFLNWKCPSP